VRAGSPVSATVRRKVLGSKLMSLERGIGIRGGSR
jgi:hypothetical protein